MCNPYSVEGNAVRRWRFVELTLCGVDQYVSAHVGLGHTIGGMPQPFYSDGSTAFASDHATMYRAAQLQLAQGSV